MSRTNPTSRRRPLLLASLPALVLAPACRGSSDPAQPLEYADDPIEVVSMIRAIPFDGRDDLAIARVSDLVATADGYALADAGGQVLLLDPDLRVAQRYAREGSGPTELRLPVDLEVFPDGRVAIYDSGNQRIALIDRHGQPIGTVPPTGLPPTDFAALSDGSIVVGRFSADHRLAFYSPAERGPFGSLPPELSTGTAGVEAAIRSQDALLVEGSDGSVHHYDSREARLYSYAPDGALLALRRLPDHTAEILERSREAAEEAFGAQRLVDFSPVLALGRAGPHPVLVAPGLPEVPGIGLVLDPLGPRATPVVAADGVPHETLRRTTVLALRGEILTTATPDGLQQYRIRYPRHLAALARLAVPRVAADRTSSAAARPHPTSTNGTGP